MQTKVHLVPVAVRLPVGDAVLLGHVPALGQQLLVRDLLLGLGALLLYELLGGQLGLIELLGNLALLTLLVGNNLEIERVSVRNRVLCFME